MNVGLVAPLVTPLREAALGGAQAMVCDLARGLTERGHDVTLYAVAGSALEGVRIDAVDADTRALERDLVRPGHERAEATPAMTELYSRVYARVVAGGHDVVHSHGFDAPAFRVPAVLGLPVLHTLHLPPDRGVAAALADARGAGPAWCAAVSRAHHEAWAALTHVDAVLPNGVPTARIPVGHGGGSAVIAARYSPEKGVQEGIAAARCAGLQVDVIGMPYDDDYERCVRQRWEGVPGVRFLPALPRAAVWRHLGGASVVICLSQWDEPFGLTAAEAQAAGTPVTVTARGGLVEVIADGVTGAVVGDGDVESAARGVRACAALERSACRQRAETLLSLDASVSAHEELYSRLAR